MDSSRILSCFQAIYKAIHPPFEKAIILPARHSKCARQLDELCTGNQEAYFTLFLQFYILCGQADPFLWDTVARLDPLQDFLYLSPETHETTFRDILDTQTSQSIAEISVLSISTALIPGAPRAWVDVVFNALPILTPREAVPVRMFFYNTAEAIRRMAHRPAPPLSDADSSPNFSGLELSPYNASLNFSTESF
ncbi:hypothetical protein AAF712_016406 [Marasmius tenuissimus]|uniref:Uncharacterized protein n=1 Tax=Marasmius tenuissimus TaxID=585030 RepID=A0ABR2Z5T8_9AGAR